MTSTVDVAPLLLTLAVTPVLLPKSTSSKLPVPPSLIWLVWVAPMSGPFTMLTVWLAAGAEKMKVGEGTVSVTGERFEKVIGTLLWAESL